MFLKTIVGLFFFNGVSSSLATVDPEVKKSYLEDIFIWKMSDELKLTAKEEKEFTTINKELNRKKSELNKEIQKSIQALSDKDAELELKNYRKLVNDYNQIATKEFDTLKKLLGTKKFIQYLKIKNDLTTKVKSVLIGERPAERRDAPLPIPPLPPPKVIVEPGE